MKKHLFLVASALIALTACNKNADLNGSLSNEISFKPAISNPTRVAGSNFENADQISVVATDADGATKGAIYTYNGTSFTSSDAFTKEEGAKLSFDAVYPKQADYASSFDFAIKADQSNDGYELSDLLVANTTATASLQPELAFNHKMSNLVLSFKLTDGTAIVPSSVVLSAKNNVACNYEANTYVASGSAIEITAAENGTIGYKAIVAPQTISAGVDFITMSYNGKSYTAAFATEAVLVSGSQYQYELVANEVAGTIESITLIGATINDWNDGNEGGTETPDPQPDPEGESVVMDGSELPTAYTEDAAIEVDGIAFVADMVANYSSQYPDSNGPIQFGKNGACLYNTEALTGLKEVIITLAPAGTQYNNFVVYAGTSANSTATELTVSKEGDVCTYTVPEGSEFVTIQNPVSYTAYAFTVEFSGSEGSSEGGNEGGTETPDPQPDPQPGETITMDGSELPTAYPENETITVGDVDFVLNMVANFSTLYPETSSGPIQFKKTESYIYNSEALTGLKEVIITLAPAGTQYNNFVVYAATSANAKTTELTVSKSGDICTYTVPSGSEFITIENTSGYAAYAFQIDFVK